MLKMPIKTLLISAAVVLFAGCTTNNFRVLLPKSSSWGRNSLRPSKACPILLKANVFDDTWGAARSQGRRHEGVDIFAKKNTPIRSTTPGIVTKIGRNRLGGKVIGIQGPGAWHYYAHLNKFARIRLYERVKEGQVIGYVGKTGNARTTPAHLHYGVYLPVARWIRIRWLIRTDRPSEQDLRVWTQRNWLRQRILSVWWQWHCWCTGCSRWYWFKFSDSRCSANTLQKFSWWVFWGFLLWWAVRWCWTSCWTLTRIAERGQEEESKGGRKTLYSLLAVFPLLAALLFGGNYLTIQQKRDILIQSSERIVKDNPAQIDALADYRFDLAYIRKTSEILDLMAKDNSSFKSAVIIVPDKIDNKPVYLAFQPTPPVLPWVTKSCLPPIRMQKVAIILSWIEMVRK